MARATRSFVALEVDVGETTTTGEPNTPAFDARRRGLAFVRRDNQGENPATIRVKMRRRGA